MAKHDYDQLINPFYEVLKRSNKEGKDKEMEW